MTSSNDSSPSNITQTKLPKNFPEHLESVAFGLVCIVQVITVKCPSAQVWYPLDDSKSCIGSPIDLLPFAPSLLPLPVIPDDDKDALFEQQQLRYLLLWCCYK